MMLGCVGWVCATGSVFARESVVFHELIKAKRYEEARDIYRWMYPVLHLDNRSTFIQCGKLALQIFGRGSEMVRLPLMPFQGSERAEVIAVVENALKTRPVLPESQIRPPKKSRALTRIGSAANCSQIVLLGVMLESWDVLVYA